MWMSVLKTTEDAVSLPLVSTYLTASIASAILDTPVMVLPAQVRHLFCRRQTFIVLLFEIISRANCSTASLIELFVYCISINLLTELLALVMNQSNAVTNLNQSVNQTVNH